MLPLYENVNDTLEIYKGETSHVSPHLHKALECVYITEGSLALGVGMCFSMVWGKMVMGVVIGLIGIVILLCLIPLTKGIKD